jgi:outer membrane protein TolC
MVAERILPGLLLAAGGVLAATPGLDSLVREVLVRHPRALEAHWNPRAQQARVAGARSWMPPSVQVAGRSDGELSVSLEQGIPWPGSRARMAQVEQRKLEMVRSDSLGTLVQLALSVREAVWMEWMAREMLGILDSQVLRADQLAETTRRNLGVGMATASDAWLADARRTQARIRRDQGVREFEAARAMRESWTGAGELPDPGSPTWASWLDDPAFDSLAARRPDLEAMRTEVAMGQAMAEAAEDALRPELMVGGMAMRMPDGMPGWGAMVGITLPFVPWASGMPRAEAAAARSKARVDQARLEGMGRMVRAETAGHRARARAAWDALRLLDSAVVPGQTRARADALERWKQGREMTSMVVAMDEMVGMAAMERIVQRQTYEVERARALAAAGRLWETEGSR